MAFEPTDDEVRRLVEEKKPLPADYLKRLAVKPKSGHKEQQLDVKGIEESEFRLILRQSNTNPLDFSIILGYRVPNTNEVFRLRRYNGKSHEHTNVLEDQTFYDYHIHMATARYREAGFREDTCAEPTDRYSDLGGALDCMLADCRFEKRGDLSGQGRLFGMWGAL